MKIKHEDFDFIQDTIREYISKNEINLEDRRADLENDSRVNDVEKRLRWDLSYEAGLTKFICYLYDKHGCDDSHIDTALKKALRNIEADLENQSSLSM